MTEKKLNDVKDYLQTLQKSIINMLQQQDPSAHFQQDSWQHCNGGGGLTCVTERAEVIERGGVNFSHVAGEQLPPSATQARPELAGRSFDATGVSLVIHPRNPFVPTVHANVRLIMAHKKNADTIWWFGGGMDLTPYYPFDEDITHWHKICQQACAEFGEQTYPKYKKACDDYFYLPHRQEARGIGGIFFDDLNEWGFEKCFAFLRSVGDHFNAAYQPILQRRKNTPYNDQHRDFQAYRRGRYVEFNLVYDRGTLFGLHSKGRTESILMSMPPTANWRYDYQPEPGSEEARLSEYLNNKTAF